MGKHSIIYCDRCNVTNENKAHTLTPVEFKINKKVFMMELCENCIGGYERINKRYQEVIKRYFDGGKVPVEEETVNDEIPGIETTNKTAEPDSISELGPIGKFEPYREPDPIRELEDFDYDLPSQKLSKINESIREP